MSIWYPIDFYLGLSFSRKRLLEVPTYCSERVKSGHRAIRLEWSLLLNVHLIVDVQRWSARRALAS